MKTNNSKDTDVKEMREYFNDSDEDESEENTPKPPKVNPKSKKIKKEKPAHATPTVSKSQMIRDKNTRKARKDIQILCVDYLDYPHRRTTVGRIKKPWQLNLRFTDSCNKPVKSNIKFAIARNITPEQVGNYKGSIHEPAWWEHNFAPLDELEKHRFYYEIRQSLGLDKATAERIELYKAFAKKYS